MQKHRLKLKKERKAERRRTREQEFSSRSTELLTQDFISNYRGDGSILIRDPKGMRKMSEVILEFAAEELELPIARSFEVKKRILQVAIIAWNLSLRSPVERLLDIEDLKQRIENSDGKAASEEIEMVLKDFIRKKEDWYPSIRRVIIDWQFFKVDDHGGSHLNIISSVMEEGDDHFELDEQIGDLQHSTQHLNDVSP
jgi:hypothetical protein